LQLSTSVNRHAFEPMVLAAKRAGWSRSPPTSQWSLGSSEMPFAERDFLLRRRTVNPADSLIALM